MIDFPNLSSAKLIGYDFETSDPFLIEEGPGWARGKGYPIGCALAVDRNNAWWIPLGKLMAEGDPHSWVPIQENIFYLKDILETDIPKVGANLQYDMGWASEIDIWPKGLQMDVQFAEALLDDIRIDDYGRKLSLSLDALAHRYLGIGKKKTEVEAFVKERWPWVKDFREKLYLCPEKLVRDYALPDAWIPIEIIKRQWQSLVNDDLTDLFKLECRLLPVLVKMRRRGLPINEDAANEARDEMRTIEEVLQWQLADLAGFTVNVNSAKDLEKLFLKQGVTNLAYTDKGNPSFTADWLNACDAPIAKQVNDLRKTTKARGTFIENAILDKHVNGKVYPSLHPLRDDFKGTNYGRFSCTQPNGQQIPKRDTKLAPTIRGIFCPEDGYPHWLCMDLSQIEYRLFAHFSEDPGLLKAYEDPNTDFHDVVAKLVGGNFPRVAYKTINFMLLYGGGKTKLTKMLASLFPERHNADKFALQIYDTYQRKFPAAQALLRKFAEEASRNQQVRTILGRIAHFTLWESSLPKEEHKVLALHKANEVWGLNRRIAGTYKAINRVLQGSAADLLKKGMVDAHENGIFDRTGYPHITVHDELDFSYHPDMYKDFLDLKHCIEGAIPSLKVPVVMEMEAGPDWGHLGKLTETGQVTRV